jgi:GTP cyclohydrolase FolE2
VEGLFKDITFSRVVLVFKNMSKNESNNILDFNSYRILRRLKQERDLARKELIIIRKKYFDLREAVINCRDCSVEHNNVDYLKSNKKEKEDEKPNEKLSRKSRIKKGFCDSSDTD